MSSALKHPEPDTAWMADAACSGVDPDLFFPGQNPREQIEPKQVCAGCPVRLDCLAYALEIHATVGIWGGKSEKERRAVRKHPELFYAPVQWALGGGPNNDVRLADGRFGTVVPIEGG